jgi:energy-coupling factor transport system permease protein
MNFSIVTKLLFTLFLLVIGFTMAWYIRSAAILGIVVVILLVPSSLFVPNARKQFVRFAFFALLFTLVILAINGAIIKEGTIRFSLFGIAIYEDGLLFALETSTRLLLVLLAFLLFFTTTSVRSLSGYINTLRVPRQLSMLLLLSLHFMDFLPKRINQIFISQQARGAPLEGSLLTRMKMFFKLLMPLVLSSIVETLDRGIALELRGVHLQSEHMPQKQGSRLMSIDIALIIFSLVLIVWRIAGWLMR